MTVRCAASNGDGVQCGELAQIVHSVPLCPTHELAVAAALLPRVMGPVLRQIVAAAEVKEIDRAAAASLLDKARSLVPDSLMTGRHDPITYFIEHGSRVKIGTTLHLRARVSALSLRPEQVLCVLDGGRELERGLHQRFARDRISGTEWFEPGSELADYIAAKIAAAEQVRSELTPAPMEPEARRPTVGLPRRPVIRYPDGVAVGFKEWPDLYRVFCDLCAEQGHASKEDLTAHGPYDSRDTVRRALDVWMEHGVEVRKEGRTELFFLSDADES